MRALAARVDRGDLGPRMNPRVAVLVQAEISRMVLLVEDPLLLAKTEQADFRRPEPIELPAVHH